MKHALYFLTLFFCFSTVAQLHKYTIDGDFSANLSSVEITQSAVFTNSHSIDMNKLYLNDWSNAYSSTKTPLARHFAEEYSLGLHRASEKKRGRTVIHQIKLANGDKINWNRLEDHPDIIELVLPSKLRKDQSVEIEISYEIFFPSDRFTQFGLTSQNNLHLSFWYLTFAGNTDNKWVLESNLDLDDLHVEPSNFDVRITIPKTHQLVSDFPFDQSFQNETIQYIGSGKRKHIPVYIVKDSKYESYSTKGTTIITDLTAEISPTDSKQSVERVHDFVASRLGSYSYDSLLIPSIEYEKRPIYGLNELPKFIRPFENNFLFEVSLLKVMVLKYFQNTGSIRLRTDGWSVYGIQIYLLMEYVNQYYPEQKLLGKFASFWGLKNYQLSKSLFNDQYELIHKFSVVKNLDQSLSTPTDKLTRYNAELSNRYKAALGLRMLDGYLENDVIKRVIKDYYQSNTQNIQQSKSFRSVLQKHTQDSLDWFFDEYVQTRKRIDYELAKVKKRKDSIDIVVRNKTNTNIPISVNGLIGDSLIYKQWIHSKSENINLSIPSKNIEKIVLNAERHVPEINFRNNYKSLDKKIVTKPIKLTFLKDIEEPSLSQVFYIPKLDYNYYDGLSPGIVLSNKTIVSRNLLYKLQPFYSPKENTVVGNATLTYFKNYINQPHYRTQFWLTGSRFHYQPGLFYRNIVPSVLFSFRDQNFRSSKRHFLNFRYIYVERDFSSEPINEPDYGIFNARYSYSHQLATKTTSFSADLQLKNSFTKLSTTLRYRNFFKDDHQFHIRLFAGAFLKNKTSDDYFSFGISSVQDYLFDYRLLGRSESEGFYSQQFVWADAGFKSKIDTPLANQWLFSLNAGISLWKWVEVYGDTALIKRKNHSLIHGFDSGIRLNLVNDYFELYFPVYSSLGLEINQPQYADKIRFVVVMDLVTLSKLITRKWL